MTQARRAVALMVLSDSPVVTAGVRAMMAPYSQRVAVEQLVGSNLAARQVDVILLDLFGQADVSARLSQVLGATQAPVLVFGSAHIHDQVDSGVRRSAAGFLTETADGEEIVTAVEAVASGDPAWRMSLPGGGHEDPRPAHSSGLTAREADVLGLIVSGLSNQDIADRLFLSVNSVKGYIRSAYRKMGVVSRSQAVLWGLEHGLQVGQPPMWRSEQH